MRQKTFPLIWINIPVGKSELNRIFIDTLFVVALINPRDQYHAIASMLATDYEGYPLLTTDCVLLEIGNALARNFKAQSIEIVDDFITSTEVKIVHLNPQIFDKAYQIYKKYKDKEWGLVDCVSFIAMQEENVDTALTFDQHFIQAGFKALMRSEGTA